MQTSKKAELRHEQICDYVSLKGAVSLQELCDRFSCSEATIRNDLTTLEKEGHLKRILGGAISVDNTARNSVISKRLNQNTEQKRQIARFVVNNIIKPGMIITLDSGTTVMALAQEIVNAKIPCTVITNSFQAAMILTKSNEVQLCLAGGTYDRDHSSFHDDISEYILNSYSSEICFLAPNGINDLGMITNSAVQENPIKMQMVKHAKKTYVLADHTKLGNTELKIICTAKEIEAVITDDKADEKVLQSLKNAGFRILIAGDGQLLDI